MKGQRINNYLSLAIVGALVAGGIWLGMVITPLRAQSAYYSIGYVDVQKALEAHPRTQAVFEQIRAYEESRRRELGQIQTQNMTEEQKQQLLARIYQIQSEVEAEKKRLTEPLIEDVLRVTQAIGQESGLEVILEAGSVIYGGLDLTPEVIRRLQNR